MKTQGLLPVATNIWRFGF